MSAIAGFWHLEGLPAADRNTAQMLAALSLYGKDNCALRDGGFIALGRQLSRMLPEDAFDHGPIVSADGRFTLAADIRLDNREELCDALGIRPGCAATLCDAAILLAGFEKWGEAVTERLVGEFAFALWDGQARKLVLARDFAGLRPLHYHAGKGFFAFASMPKGLLTLPGIPCSCDEERAIEFLLLPESGPRTFFSGIRRVEAGHIVTVNNGEAVQRRYWDPPRGKLRLRGSDDYAEALRDHLDRAVRSRLRGTGGRVGAHLSGGFDSAAVTAAAARIEGGAGGRVTAFTSIPKAGFVAPASSRYIADEGPLASAVTAMYPNIDHVLIRAGHISPFEDLERDCFLYDRPSLNISNHPWLSAINDAARERGIRVLLTGQMGNISASYAGIELLPELFRSGRWWKLAAESRALVRNGFRTTRGAVSAAVSPAIPPWLRGRLGRGRGGGVPRYVALNPARARPRPGAVPARDSVSFRISALHRVDPGNFNKGMLGAWGIEIRDPTADRRLVEFCLSVPTEQFLSGGVPRTLARRAFAGRLPAELLRERRIGLQAADWYDGLTAGREQAAGEIESIASCETAAAILDVPRLRALMENWPSDGWEREEIQQDYGLALTRALALGCFLRNRRPKVQPVP